MKSHSYFGIYYRYDVLLSRTVRLLILYSQILLSGTLSLIIYRSRMESNENSDYLSNIPESLALSIGCSLLLLPFEKGPYKLLFAEERKTEQPKPLQCQ